MVNIQIFKTPVNPILNCPIARSLNRLICIPLHFPSNFLVSWPQFVVSLLGPRLCSVPNPLAIIAPFGPWPFCGSFPHGYDPAVCPLAAFFCNLVLWLLFCRLASYRFLPVAILLPFASRLHYRNLPLAIILLPSAPRLFFGISPQAVIVPFGLWQFFCLLASGYFLEFCLRLLFCRLASGSFSVCWPLAVFWNFAPGCYSAVWPRQLFCVLASGRFNCLQSDLCSSGSGCFSAPLPAPAVFLLVGLVAPGCFFASWPWRNWIIRGVNLSSGSIFPRLFSGLPCKSPGFETSSEPYAELHSFLKTWTVCQLRKARVFKPPSEPYPELHSFSKTCPF